MEGRPWIYSRSPNKENFKNKKKLQKFIDTNLNKVIFDIYNDHFSEMPKCKISHFMPEMRHYIIIVHYYAIRPTQ